MKKIIKKIKKCLLGIGNFLLIIPGKVFAIDEGGSIPLYGVPDKEEMRYLYLSIFLQALKIFLIPITLLIGGTILYLKKSKASKKRKIIVALLVLTIIIFLLINLYYYAQNLYYYAQN